jgi:RimJ/RimL family protein N-acetyltransferase
MQLDLGTCRIRSWSLADKESLVLNANNRSVWRNLLDRFPHPYTPADADDWLQQMVAEVPSTNFVIDVDGQLAGVIGFVPLPGMFRFTAEFGYWLGEHYWGRGIMTAAAQAVAEHAFTRHELYRLEAHVFEWNPASMRVLEKAGFVREGVLRKSIYKDGELIDRVMYARLKSPLPTNPV